MAAINSCAEMMTASVGVIVGVIKLCGRNPAVSVTINQPLIGMKNLKYW